MTKKLLYWCLVLFSAALSLEATINKCTEGENGLVYCEDISTQGQAFLNKRNDITCLSGENDVHFGTIQDFALFAFDKIEAQGFSLNGKVAAKNSITTGGYSITTNGNCKDGTLTYSAYTDVFSMSWSGGSLEGGIHYGTSYSMPKYEEDKLKNNKCPISNDESDNLNFDAIEKRMKEISKSLLELPANAELVKPYSDMTLKLKSDVKQYVIKANENTFNKNGGFNFNIDGNLNPEDITIVINYEGNEFTLKSSSYTPEKYQKRIIWNLPNATKVTFNSATIYGLIIAPNADVNLSSGNLYGNLICKSIVTGSVNIGSGSYTGCVPYMGPEETSGEEEPLDEPSGEEDEIYEVDGVYYRNETVCSKENVESKEINSDIVFVFDESISMCDYIDALRNKLQDFIDELSNVGANTRFAVIGFGGKPRIYSAFTDKAKTVKAAFNKLNCEQGGQESGLEAMRMFLQKSKSFIDKTTSNGNSNYVNVQNLEFRAGSTRTVILVTDEDSDIPHYRENMNDLQINNLNRSIDVNKYYKKDVSNIDQFIGFPYYLSYGYNYYYQVQVKTAYGISNYIEPTFSPARLDLVYNPAINEYVMTFYRSGSPIVLSKPFQKEVDDTAKLLMKENIQLFMLLNDDLQKAQGERVANSQFSDKNPYWNSALKNIKPADDSSTITSQYGNPLLDDVSKEYNRDKILEGLVSRKQEKSVQGQLLSNRGFCRAFNIKNFVTSDKNDMVKLLYKTIVSTVQNCVVKPVPVPAPVVETESESEEEEEEVETTTSTIEEIQTIYEMPTEWPTLPYVNVTSCANSDLESEEINTDIVFIFDESISMCKYIDPMREKLNVLIEQLKENHAKARFAVIGFGGAPRIYSSFTSDITEIQKAFEKLNCKEGGQESGLEAIRMFLNGSKKFINKIDSVYNEKKFKKVSELKWRKNSTKTIILVTDEDSDLPIYEENFNELQKANFENNVNIKSLDGKDIVAADVEAFGGFPYYLNKNYLPKYSKEIFYEPVFSPASLTTIDGTYTFFRNGGPLVLSEAFQKEVDETANLIIDQGVHLFMLLNDNLADSQGADVANSQFNSENPYWISKGISEGDDSSTITAQYGNPELDQIQNEEYNSVEVYKTLVKNKQENSLQGQILSKNGFCRAFNMKQFTSDDSEKMVELFYRTVVKAVVKCVITPEILVTEITETLTTTSEYTTDSIYEITTESLYTTDSIATETLISVVTETTVESTTIEPTTYTIEETKTVYETSTVLEPTTVTVEETTYIEETSTLIEPTTITDTEYSTIEPETSEVTTTSTTTTTTTVEETTTTTVEETTTTTVEETTTATEEEITTSTTTVEDVQESTTIPVNVDTTSSIESTTSTEPEVETSTTEIYEEETTSVGTDEVPLVIPIGTEPDEPEKDEPKEQPQRTILTFAVGGASIAGAAAAALYFKFRPRTPAGNQLADTVFEDNVGMENPLYEGTAGQNENPLYEANLEFDSLDDNIDAFA